MKKVFLALLLILFGLALVSCRDSPVFADELEIDVDGSEISTASEDDLASASTEATFTYQSRYVVFLDDLDDYLENYLGTTSRGNYSYSGSFQNISASTLKTYVDTYGTWPSYIDSSGYYSKIAYGFTSASTFIEEWGSGDGYKQLSYVGQVWDNGFLSGTELSYTDVTSVVFTFNNCGIIPYATSGSSSVAYRYTHELTDLYDVQYCVVCIEYDYNGSTYQIYRKLNVTGDTDYSLTISLNSSGVDITGYAIYFLSYSSEIDSYTGTFSSNSNFTSAFGIDVDSYPYISSILITTSSVSSMCSIDLSDYDSDLSSYISYLSDVIYDSASSINSNMATYYNLLSSAISSISTSSSDSVDLSTIEGYLYDIKYYVVRSYSVFSDIDDYLWNYLDVHMDNVESYLSSISDKLDNIGSNYDFESLLIPESTVYDDSYSSFSTLVDDHFGFLSTTYDYATDFYSTLSSSTADDSFVFPGVSLTLSDDVTFEIASQTVSVSEYIPSDMLVYVRVTLTALFIFAWLNGMLAIYHRIFKLPTC